MVLLMYAVQSMHKVRHYNRRGAAKLRILLGTVEFCAVMGLSSFIVTRDIGFGDLPFSWSVRQAKTPQTRTPTMAVDKSIYQPSCNSHDYMNMWCSLQLRTGFALFVVRRCSPNFQIVSHNSCLNIHVRMSVYCRI